MRRTLVRLFSGWLLVVPLVVTAADFVAFESGQVRPLALAPDGEHLYAVNTPDNRLEIFAVTDGGLVHEGAVPVGMEPVAVAVRRTGEVWVVNHLSDSVSVVDVAAKPPRVVRTLNVGDEPRDIVFAGRELDRAFITTAHRGQNSPYTHPNNPGELTTPGIGRADVWVFDADHPGTPLTVLSLFTDTPPRALAVTPDGATVYAAGFHTGNRTTVLSGEIVCDGGPAAWPCRPSLFEQLAPGGLPGPTKSAGGATRPEVGLIVKHDGHHWVDELGRNWDSMVRFSLPDEDVFAIDAQATPPVQRQAYPHVGTVLFNMVVNPANGKVYVANTEARNEVRFEGGRPAGSTLSTVQGRLAESRITVLDGTAVLPRHLNKHIDYRQRPAPPEVKERSLATPMGMAVSADGRTLYLAAFGSSKIGIFDTEALDDDSFTPSADDHVELTDGGPSGLVLDEARGRLYVLTRFRNSVTVVDTESRREIARHAMHNPEPESVVAGRPFLYDARLTSSNGEAACASCHIFGDTDSLAWDLGNPLGDMLNHPGPFRFGPIGNPDFHPMKGPMATQSLRGMAGQGPMHWRGDRTGGNDAASVEPASGSFDEEAGFKKFNGAFVDLLGRGAPLSDAQMQAFSDFILQVTYPPNPIRNLDNSLTPKQKAGRDFYFNAIADLTLTQCNGCHVIDRRRGLFGTDGRAAFVNETQHFKIPHVRNMYQKVGMFGRVQTIRDLSPVNNRFRGPQIRGFGFRHDGSIDTLLHFFKGLVFLFPGGDAQRATVEQFLFAVDTNLFPSVGQQVTLRPDNAATARPRIDLLAARAKAGDCELIAKGVRNDQPYGWWRNPGDGRFLSDHANEPTLSLGELTAVAQATGEPMTFTCVPPGSGRRMAIDRDRDGVLDGSDGL